MLLEIENLSYHVGALTILENINWRINPNEKIGLIGKNGAGKSTLLRLINEEYYPTIGKVHKRKGLSLAYFHQDLLSMDLDDSLLFVALPFLKEIQLLEIELQELEAQLHNTPTPEESILLDYSHKLVYIEELRSAQQNKTIEAQKVLIGLGFKESQFQDTLKTFSGGWRMRAFLAQMILRSPDILMLDEPTNHLDLPTIKWLEKYLVSYPQTVVVVSHDRQFLNQITCKIVEIELGQLTEYTGNYTDYENKKAEHIAIMQKAYTNQQQFIQQQERFIERFRAKASKAAQAQSAMKRLDKLEKIILPETDTHTINLRFEAEKESGKMVFEAKQLYKNYGERTILHNADAQILRNQKIALIGENGLGKSTLLRIAGNIDHNFEGKIQWGHNVTMAFYAQHQIEHLNLHHTILEEAMTSSHSRTSQEVRTILGGFLFSGDTVEKKVKVLSGGEKARLALVKVILMKANFILLDEPTNHLDISSIQILKDAIKQYQGTVLIVSHDRYFLQNTANTIWEIKDKHIKHFEGTYDEWEWFKDNKKNVDLNPPQQYIDMKQQANPKYQQHPTLSSQAKKEIQREFKNVENKINQLETQKSLLQQQLNDSNLYNQYAEFQKIEKQYNTLQQELITLHSRYEELFDKIATIQ